MNDVIVFLGPTLPAAEARSIIDCEVRPPARQGDLFRALHHRPRLIVLIDGVFESTPSVWHHEILAAHACGIPVLGASSMGALRAAELAPTGTMVGVGEIFEAFLCGALVDDAEVALLHASAEHAFRPLTVPLVNVRHAAELALDKRVLIRAEAEALVHSARETFYQDRRWGSLLEEQGWTAKTQSRWETFAAGGLPDLKAADARACLGAAKKWRTETAPHPRLFPSNVRRRRLFEDRPAGAPAFQGVKQSEQGAKRTEEGVRRKLIAAWARELGLTISADELEDEEARWLEAVGVPVSERDHLLESIGLDESQARALVEELALERKAVRHARWMVSDASSDDEALAFELTRQGVAGRPAPRKPRVR